MNTDEDEVKERPEIVHGARERYRPHLPQSLEKLLVTLHKE